VVNAILKQALYSVSNGQAETASTATCAYRLLVFAY
jgi:hypothetical protein